MIYLLYSPTLEAHLYHLILVLQKLREHKLYMKSSKCSFAKTKLEYLGHIIARDGFPWFDWILSKICQTLWLDS